MYGSEVEPDETEVVPSFTTSVVEDDEGPTWCDRVGKEVVGCTKNAVMG